MRPSLHHASRLAAHAAPIAPSARTLATFTRTPLVCARSPFLDDCRTRRGAAAFPASWIRRHLSSSTRWMDEGKKSDPFGSSSPIPMPPPPSSTPPPLTPPPSSTTPPSSDFNIEDVPEHLIPPHLRPVKPPPDPPKEEPKPVKPEPLEPESTEPEIIEQATTTPKESSKESSYEHTEQPLKNNASSSTKEPIVEKVTSVPNEQLPSHHQGQRWDFSKRFQKLMDDVLPKLAVVTQKVNTYTGTDYSGVAALRREIKEQEKLVKARRVAIDSAKQALDAAHAQQASSQKEVVALLERKHSWTAGDLERYMSLIRSEHLNDQAVREAKEAVSDAENALEEARSHLEKRERAQYHEEQIWSDTIRRNSTWVTFGLMGLNIFLLLLSLLVFEPWRRRRMVREIKDALEAHKATAPIPASVAAPVAAAIPEVAASAIAEPAVASTPANDTAAVEAQIDKVVEPVVELPSPPSPGSSTTESPTPIYVADIKDAMEDSTNSSFLEEPSSAAGESPADILTPPDHITGLLQIWQWKATAIAQDIMSDRSISMRRVDYTTAMLQAAAAGAVIAAAVIAMMKPY